ncbi:MAG: exosortase K [Spirochaetaceae bacterium]
MKYIAVIIFGVLKLFYINANNRTLLFMLTPINKIVCLVTNTQATVGTEGYLNNSLNIIINKSCSGFNFFLVIFVMTFVMSFKYINSTFQKTVIIPCLLMTSYLVTIFVNSSRILISLKTSYLLTNQNITLPWLHYVEGIFIYLFFLILIYTILDKSITKRMYQNEQFN